MVLRGGETGGSGLGLEGAAQVTFPDSLILRSGDGVIACNNFQTAQRFAELS